MSYAKRAGSPLPLHSHPQVSFTTSTTNHVGKQGVIVPQRNAASIDPVDSNFGVSSSVQPRGRTYPH